MISLLILMSSSGPFNLASGSLLVVPPLIRNCLNLPFETQGKSRRLKAFSYQQETGDPERLLYPGGLLRVLLSFRRKVCKQNVTI